MGKRKGKSGRKSKVREQRPQRAEEAKTTGPVATSRGHNQKGNSGSKERKVEGGGANVKPASASPVFVSGIKGMSDEWRAFYRVVSQAVQER